MSLSRPSHLNFYPNASNFTIGTQNIIIHNEQSTGRTGRFEPPSPIPDASHNRNRKTSPPDSSCLPGTRIAAITNILTWAKSDEGSHRQVILWLCGAVGAGKSAISQAVAEDLDSCGRLAASFFFFRGAGDRSQFSKFAITLASQMAIAIPATAPYITEALKRMSGWSVSKQMEALVYRPIRLALADESSGFPVTILLDGLDECQDKEEVEEFLDHVLESFNSHSLKGVRFIIASRIEQHIQTNLETESVRIENLASYVPDDDIRTFLSAIFSRAAKRNRVIRAYGDWPKSEDLDSLTQHIRGSFIFASTIVKYILDSSDDGLTPIERLPLALEMNPGLDGLYTETLKRSSHCPHFTDIIASAVLPLKPLSVSELSQLLEIPSFQILNTLVNLQAIIHIPDDDYSPITTFHVSLRDFLMDKDRSGSLFVPAIHHARLAFKWLEPPSINMDHTRKSICRHCNDFMGCDTVDRAHFHWKQILTINYHDNDWNLPFIGLFGGLLSHFFPSRQLALVDYLSQEEEYDTFYGLVIAALCPGDSYGPWNRLLYTLKEWARGNPPHIPHYGRIPSILVHAGVRIFNLDESLTRGKPFTGAVEHMLRFWVKHLAAAVQSDPELTLEVLRVRVMHTSESIAALKNDVFAAEIAIQNRFPGALSDMSAFPTLEARSMYNANFNFYKLRFGSPGGISILDIFNAYRAFSLTQTRMLHSSQDFQIKFTHSLGHWWRRGGDIELSLRKSDVDGPYNISLGNGSVDSGWAQDWAPAAEH
ncbi:hypothetical protein NMY22_g11749 [Coprinellus aureogranulatus]|nr:hypothetical protein NMY22_g11749 [Coprinellus aureogranulatus]